ncbi:endospore germination permease [Mesobacillus foraminis]|uniref:GerAB/ArcD/ProY family transporter n=1 Tax=Mesobacillus foraminis TaxID=279826 RepID=UPI001BE7D3ED|nr:endospore germination permease [Mesobacillus foraminis]MBT2755378.1 endospore germination permease [Mesobacillus foraminis]
MSEKISPFELAMLVANFLFTGTLISLPQALVEASGQNTWMVPVVVFIFMSLFVWVVMGRQEKLAGFSKRFLSGKRTVLEKLFLVSFGLLFATAYIRDVRAMVDFVATVLLPTTPIDILTILAVLAVIYLASSGLEVIARVTMIQFIALAGTVLFLPFMVLNEITFGNFQPIVGRELIIGVAQSSFLLLAWIGEGIFILILLANMNNAPKARNGAITGIGIAMFLLTVLIALQVSVLGVEIVTVSPYPSHQLIQQINLTDFLDRLDLVIVTVWIPTFFTKIALDLYLLNRCLTSGRSEDLNIFMIPLGLCLGLLSILLFRNNMEHIQFSFYTWAVWGLVVEMLIGLLFMMRRKFSKS